MDSSYPGKLSLSAGRLNPPVISAIKQFLLAFRGHLFRIRHCHPGNNLSRYGAKHTLNANGPAIKGGCVTWRSHPATYPGALAVIYPGGKTGMACFLPSGCKFYCM